LRGEVAFLVLDRIVGLGLFVLFSRPLLNAFPIVSAKIIVAGNFAAGKSPLSLNMSRANSKGTLIIKPEFLGFLGFNFSQPDVQIQLCILKDYESQINSAPCWV
jgi:hypothetical protein